MARLDRRRFLQSSAATAVGASLIGAPAAARHARAAELNLKLAPFRFDVTPPMGHSLCGGWIKPVVDVDDSLEAIGLVILGAGKPMVLCAVDWTGLLNDAHVAWRTALAEAAGTTPERVAVQCVHQHNAPFACLNAEQMVAAQGDLPHIVDVEFFQRCLAEGRKAINQAIPQAKPLTHIAHGQAKVSQVAGNRRIHIGPDGRVLAMRGSACNDPQLRELPEGLIDPWLKTVAFFSDGTKIAACHYYATHPMSYYGDGRVSSDFVGLARKRRQQDEPQCTHLYFTGCAGNIAAGKYNDGSKEMRAVLTQRMYDGIVGSEKELLPQPISQIDWKTQDILPPVRSGWNAEEIEQQIANKQNPVAARNRPSFQLAWLQRVARKTPPIVLSALHMNDISLLHLPSESFIEYQLRIQAMQPSRFVATAAYGDGGPWYIPTKEAFPQGGYEVSVAFCNPEVDEVLTNGARSLFGDA